MAKNPKIEFFIININSYKKEKPTFRDLFTELYSIKKSKNTRDNIDNSILMNTFLQYVFDKISGKYKVDNQKKKAFYIEKEKKKNLTWVRRKKVTFFLQERDIFSNFMVWKSNNYLKNIPYVIKW